MSTITRDSRLAHRVTSVLQAVAPWAHVSLSVDRSNPRSPARWTAVISSDGAELLRLERLAARQLQVVASVLEAIARGGSR